MLDLISARAPTQPNLSHFLTQTLFFLFLHTFRQKTLPIIFLNQKSHCVIFCFREGGNLFNLFIDQLCGTFSPRRKIILAPENRHLPKSREDSPRDQKKKTPEKEKIDARIFNIFFGFKKFSLNQSRYTCQYFNEICWRIDLFSTDEGCSAICGRNLIDFAHIELLAIDRHSPKFLPPLDIWLLNIPPRAISFFLFVLVTLRFADYFVTKVFSLFETALNQKKVFLFALQPNHNKKKNESRNLPPRQARRFRQLSLQEADHQEDPLRPEDRDGPQLLVQPEDQPSQARPTEDPGAPRGVLSNLFREFPDVTDLHRTAPKEQQVRVRQHPHHRQTLRVGGGGRGEGPARFLFSEPARRKAFPDRGEGVQRDGVGVFEEDILSVVHLFREVRYGFQHPPQ
jgi:hypothetical protein